MRGLPLLRRSESFLTAPFTVRSYRFQWPGDLLTSWAFEMETLILGWYVLIETESVFLLTAFAALQYIGTLASPMFGVMGDRFGRRRTLCAMRAAYAVLAVVLMVLGLADALNPAAVLVIALLGGMVRPSDLVLRYALIGDTMTPARLTGAMGLARVTQDSARIAGALAGAGLFATVGLGPAYIMVVLFYALAFLLTLGVEGAPPRPREEEGPRRSRWFDLREGLSHITGTPAALALMSLAFLVNITAFPFSMGLLPYVAKEVYGIDETGLGHLVAAVAGGALVGSVVAAAMAGRGTTTRLMIVQTFLWYALLGVFAHVQTKEVGLVVLAAMGFVQSLAMISMSTALLRSASERFRARVMGVRLLAVYGLPLGLLGAGQLIERYGFEATLWCFVAAGAAGTWAIAHWWRAAIWHQNAN